MRQGMPKDRKIYGRLQPRLEAVGGFLIARAYIKNQAQFLATVKLLFILVMMLALMLHLIRRDECPGFVSEM